MSKASDEAIRRHGTTTIGYVDLVSLLHMLVFQYFTLGKMRTALGEDPEEKQHFVGLPRRLSPRLSPIRGYGT